MPFDRTVNVSRSSHPGRCGELSPPGDPEFMEPGEYGPCFQILGAINRIMAEHFGIQGKDTPHRRGRVSGHEEELTL